MSQHLEIADVAGAEILKRCREAGQRRVRRRAKIDPDAEDRVVNHVLIGDRFEQDARELGPVAGPGLRSPADHWATSSPAGRGSGSSARRAQPPRPRSWSAPRAPARAWCEARTRRTGRRRAPSATRGPAGHVLRSARRRPPRGRAGRRPWIGRARDRWCWRGGDGGRRPAPGRWWSARLGPPQSV